MISNAGWSMTVEEVTESAAEASMVLIDSDDDVGHVDCKVRRAPHQFVADTTPPR